MPAGFLATSVRPSPLQVGCCPGGSFSEEVSQAGRILAATGVATDDTSSAADSVTAIAASAANVSLCDIVMS